MDNQEAFDKVWHHMIKQGVPAMEKSLCMYRGPNGTSCALGCLIKDEDYNPDIEGFSLKDWDGEFSLPDYFSDVDTRLLEKLQYCHDLSAEEEGFLQRFQGRARIVAENFNLTVPTSIGENV